MRLSLPMRCYLTLGVSAAVAMVGTWLVAGALNAEDPSRWAVPLVVGLVLVAAAVFAIIEAAHLTVVATAATVDECAQQAGALLELAERQVLIVAGEGSAAFWDRPEVAEPLMAAVDRGVSVETVIGSSASSTAEVLLNLVHSGRISLYEVTYTPSPHFMVVDSSGFRIESPHALGAEVRDGFAWRRGTTGARILEEQFASMRAEATKWGWR